MIRICAINFKNVIAAANIFHPSQYPMVPTMCIPNRFQSTETLDKAAEKIDENAFSALKRERQAEV